MIRPTAPRWLTTVVLAGALTGCAAGGEPEDRADAETPATAVSESPEVPDSPTANTLPGTSPSPTATAFDLEALPVSDAELGEFPYFGIPDGYENPNSPIKDVDPARAPFWNGQDIEWVRGKVHQSLIHADKQSSFSRSNLLLQIEDMITGAGGVKITDSEMPRDVYDTIPQEVAVEYNAGLGDTGSPIQTYVVRRADSAVWVHVGASSASAGWIIAEGTSEATEEGAERGARTPADDSWDY